jgi:hypothetical protein
LFYQLDIIIDMLANDHEQDHLASNSNDAMRNIAVRDSVR